VQSSASPDRLSPVERELDRFPCLLKSGLRARREGASCRPCSARACSLDLFECALNKARRAHSCGRRSRRRRAGRAKLIGLGKRA